MNEKITIDDLVDWIDRPPSNEDLTVCKYIANRINNWNELKKKLERRIKSYEERKKLGKGYELTEVMEISLACDKRFLKDMQELEQGKDE